MRNRLRFMSAGNRASEAEVNESSSFASGKWSQPLATISKTRTLCGPNSCLKGSPSHKPAQVHPGYSKNTGVPSHQHVHLDERSPVRQSNDAAIHPSTRHDLSRPEFSPTSHAQISPPGNSVHSRRHQFQQPAAAAAADVIYRPTTYANGGRPQFDHAVNSFKGGYAGAGSSRRNTQQDYFHGNAAATSWSRRHHPPSRGWEEDDDGATTTSGSYVVDPKELCEDIDDLFFRDDRKAL